MKHGHDATGAAGRDTDVAEIADGSNSFAIDLYSGIAAGAENPVFSPSSMSLAFAMTYAGASGETAQEMADVLHFSLPPGRLHAAFKQMRESARTGGVELRIANRLWGQIEYRFLPEFLEITGDCYGSPIEGMDFINASEDARRRINAWIVEQTAGKIRELISPGILDSMTRLVLTNAIYFLGSWEHEFDVEATTSDPFHTAGEERLVPMMHLTRRFPFAEFDDFQILELPYRSQIIDFVSMGGADDAPFGPVINTDGESDFGMCIVLPRARDGLREIETRLSPANLNRWLRMDAHRVAVSLPRFRMEASFMLNEVLLSMGMEKAFSDFEADFSRMSDDPEGLYIAAALHKAFVEVNEKGTEAAAATAVVMAGRGLSREPPPKEFRADHPFLFLIRDRRTGLIHFIGSVTNPPAPQ